MASQFTQLLAVAALAGGMFVVAGGQQTRAPQTAAVVHKPAQTAPVTKFAPPQRSSDHRKLHRTAPKIAKRKWEPLPKIKPIPPIMKEEKRRERVKVKPRTKSLPSCAVIRARRDSMTWAEQLAAYSRATPEEVAYGRRCLGI